MNTAEIIFGVAIAAIIVIAITLMVWLWRSPKDDGANDPGNWGV